MQLAEEQALLENISTIEKKIAKYHSDKKAKSAAECDNDDDLDDFVSNLSNEKQLDKTEIRKMRFDVLRLKGDHVKLQKLIKIARPFELPPLLPPTIATSSQSGTETKKKLVLPLFGKKGTFSFRSAVPAKKPRVEEVKQDSNAADEPEEEEEENEVVQEAESTEETPVVANTTEKPEKSKNKPTEMRSHQPVIEDHAPADQKETHVTSESTSTATDESTSSKRKRKNRNRHRNRNKNTERMDYDDSEELADTTKYSKWVPPEDQAGDGMTDLNSKFGY